MENQDNPSYQASTAGASPTDASRNIRDNRNLFALVLIIVFYSMTLWSYLSPWRGGALSVSAIASIVISLILQLALLYRNSILTKSVTTIAMMINLILLCFYSLMYVDSTANIATACMIVIVPLALFVTLYDIVSEKTLIGIILIVWILLALLLGMTYGLRLG